MFRPVEKDLLGAKNEKHSCEKCQRIDQILKDVFFPSYKQLSLPKRKLKHSCLKGD